ncbi:hypothetical protein [Roseibacillus ishigakijimensis]|uniref:Cadherin domain-containing protein n=1 Tax=Roseibacillus ishigakijimensis TaxID=454146 RepID=A0A934RUN7_9BACT|nr:hypothetical protein [Roseibacillus ishigakijimensis]MBK1835329.1 hypothetical protein [Roseibacillus ishigakijimensis]
MKATLITSLVAGATAVTLPAQTLLFSDTFNTDADGQLNSFNPPAEGRLGGLAAGETALESFAAHQNITGNRLDFIGTGGARFGGETARFNWGGETTGPTILAAGGLTFRYEWTHSGNTSEWLALKAGTNNSDTGVNAAGIDYAFLIRQGFTASGESNESWDNGVALGFSGQNYAPVAGEATTYEVEISYYFESFDDGSPVSISASVDGTRVLADAFTWEDNGNAVHFEFHANRPDNFLDNLTIETVTEVPLLTRLDGQEFVSGDPEGTVVGSLVSWLAGNEVGANYELVSGEGDSDNALFQISGDQLQTAGDFTGPASTDGQEYSVRVRATSTAGGGEVDEVTYRLRLTKDDDLDDLPDSWELSWAEDLTVLSGLDFADADGDTLTDTEEYQLNEGQFVGFGAYPDLDPTKADTDGDQLSDLAELYPTSLRPATNPTLADTDYDGLSDLVETNTGLFVDANDTGTDPVLDDWDGDGARDGWELSQLSDGAAMFDDQVMPESAVPAITVTPVTDDASSLISLTKVYTHALSGGTGVTINGVTMDEVSVGISPPNFLWSTSNGADQLSTAENLGQWLADMGGVTGSGLIALYNSFTWSGNGDVPGGSQTYTLSGLTPGEDYLLRLYIRSFDPVTARRVVDLTFRNGDEELVPYRGLAEDASGYLLGTFNNDQAYFLTWPYTAESEEVSIEARIALGAQTGNGSFHFYGLTNEIEGAVAALPPLVTSISRAASGEVTLTLSGSPETAYRVLKSPDLATPFAELDSPLAATTDATGTATVTIPAAEFDNAGKYFLRLQQ